MTGKKDSTGQRKVFLGSSSTAQEYVEEVAAWLENMGVEPDPWSSPKSFLPGSTVMRQLLDKAESEEVVGAVIAGALGEANTIALVIGTPKLPSDFSGVYIDLSKPNNAKVKLREWVNGLSPHHSTSKIFREHMSMRHSAPTIRSSRDQIFSLEQKPNV